MRYLLILTLICSIAQAQPIHDYSSPPTQQEQSQNQEKLCQLSEHDIAVNYLRLEDKYNKNCKGTECVQMVQQLHKDLKENFEAGASAYYSRFCLSEGE